MARPLEGDELIAQGHHTAKRLEGHAIRRIGILRLIVVVITHHTEMDFGGGLQIRHNKPRGINGVVSGLLKAAEGEAVAFLDDADP